MLMYFIGWIIGVFVGSFFIIQPLIILLFSIPYTIKLRKMDALGINAPVITRDVISFIVQIIIFIGIYFLIKSLSHNLLIGFYVGDIFILIIGISKVFKNKDNIADYMEHNAHYIHPDFLKIYLNHFMENEPDSKFKHAHLIKMGSKINM